MKLIDAIKINSSEKSIWEYQYKINFLTQNNISFDEISDNQREPAGIAKHIIDSKLQNFLGTVFSDEFREFAIKMNAAKKIAFK